MSDGPYKSLPMKPRWRRVAKCAYQEAYSQDEVVECVTRASHADWRAEVRPSLLASVSAIVSGEGQQALFTDQIRRDLQVLQRSCASPMEASLVRNLLDAVQGGRFGTKTRCNSLPKRRFRTDSYATTAKLKSMRRDDSIAMQISSALARSRA